MKYPRSLLTATMAVFILTSTAPLIAGPGIQYWQRRAKEKKEAPITKSPTSEQAPASDKRDCPSKCCPCTKPGAQPAPETSKP